MGLDALFERGEAMRGRRKIDIPRRGERFERGLELDRARFFEQALRVEGHGVQVRVGWRGCGRGLIHEGHDLCGTGVGFAVFGAERGLPIERAEDQDGGGAKESTVGTLLGLADGGAGDAGGGGQAILREPAINAQAAELFAKVHGQQKALYRIYGPGLIHNAGKWHKWC